MCCVFDLRCFMHDCNIHAIFTGAVPFRYKGMAAAPDIARNMFLS